MQSELTPLGWVEWVGLLTGCTCLQARLASHPASQEVLVAFWTEFD